MIQFDSHTDLNDIYFGTSRYNHGTPFRLLDGPEPWHPLRDQKGNRLPRRAGISSFGFGGVNAHAVIEQAPVAVGPARPATGPEVIVLSAQSAQALRATAQALSARNPFRALCQYQEEVAAYDATFCQLQSLASLPEPLPRIRLPLPPNV